MSSTREKVDQLEAELRSSSQKPIFGMNMFTQFSKMTIALTIIVNFFILGFLVIFQPGFVTYQDDEGDIHVSFKKVLLWWGILDILVAIAYYAYKYQYSSNDLDF